MKYLKVIGIILVMVLSVIFISSHREQDHPKNMTWELINHPSHYTNQEVSKISGYVVVEDRLTEDVDGNILLVGQYYELYPCKDAKDFILIFVPGTDEHQPISKNSEARMARITCDGTWGYAWRDKAHDGRMAIEVSQWKPIK